MKIKIFSFSIISITAVLLILPVVLLVSSCNEDNTVTGVLNTESGTQSDEPVSNTYGNMRIEMRFNNNTVFQTNCFIAQAHISGIAIARYGLPIIIKSVENVESIRVINWRGGTLWGRVIAINTVTDSLCCTTVRYTGGLWYFENATDTIVRPANDTNVFNCYEKCFHP